MIVTGEHGVVQQVLHFDFVFGIGQRLHGVASAASRRKLGLPLGDRCLHAPGFRTGWSVEILELLGIGLQVVEFGAGSFDPLGVISA